MVCMKIHKHKRATMGIGLRPMIRTDGRRVVVIAPPNGVRTVVKCGYADAYVGLAIADIPSTDSQPRIETEGITISGINNL